ncbi:hypothetical protein ACFVH4_13800 [Nocardia ignorata]|uniref:hypothetical protein n=1 Tax=Nocardia ignorata TaxID=145285 RepID=UPI003640F053
MSADHGGDRRAGRLVMFAFGIAVAVAIPLAVLFGVVLWPMPTPPEHTTVDAIRARLEAENDGRAGRLQPSFRSSSQAPAGRPQPSFRPSGYRRPPPW